MNGVGNRYLLDTNILIYYFNGDTVVQPIFDEIIEGDAIGFYAPITRNVADFQPIHDIDRFNPFDP